MRKDGPDDEGVSGKTEMTVWSDIDSIDVDYTKNTLRAALYEYDGKPCCFREEDIQDLLESLPKKQLQPVVVVVNPATRRHELVEGYRRYYTICVLRDRGIPLPQGYCLWIVKKPKDKDSAEARESALLSGAMNSVKPPSVMDVAFYAERLTLPLVKGGHGLTSKEAAEKLGVVLMHSPFFRSDGCSEQTLQKLKRLCTVSPDKRLAVHEGRMPWTRALKKASKEGDGNVRGPRVTKGVKHSDMRSFGGSDSFSALVPENVTRDDFLAIIRYAADASQSAPEWFLAAMAAEKSPKSNPANEDANEPAKTGTNGKNFPPRAVTAPA